MKIGDIHISNVDFDLLKQQRDSLNYVISKIEGGRTNNKMYYVELLEGLVNLLDTALDKNAEYQE